MLLLQALRTGCRSQRRTLGTGMNTYEHELQRYFETTKFSLGHDNDLDRLKKFMGLVYPRQRRLVLIDVEAYERSPLIITEIGIAVYNPHNMEHALLPHIQSMHLIVKQHKNKLNGKFVPDNKFGFNGGVSYLIANQDVKEVLQKVITSTASHHDVFVSHGVGSDIRFLRLMGVEIPEELHTVDTHTLYSMSFDRYATLKHTCRTLSIPVSRMHNGGNDAYYTLLAAMKMCDPSIRTKLGLDQHKQMEVRSKKEMQTLKFSERATMETRDGSLVWHELETLWTTLLTNTITTD